MQLCGYTQRLYCNSQQMLRVTQTTVSKLIEDGKFVIALGGEHSITAGVVEAYRQAYQMNLYCNSN